MQSTKRAHYWAFIACIASVAATNFVQANEEIPPIPIPDSVRQLVAAVRETVEETIIVAPPSSPEMRASETVVARIEFAPTQRVTTRSLNGIFQLVGLLPLQAVKVTVQYPLARVGEIVRAEVLDGGGLSVPTDEIPPPPLGGENVAINRMLVDEQGTVTFRFQPRSHPGLYQVRLSSGNREWGLPFYVLDQLRPGNNPPALRPGPEPSPPKPEPPPVIGPGPTPLPIPSPVGRP